MVVPSTAVGQHETGQSRWRMKLGLILLNRFSIAREADEKKGGETGWMGWKRTNGVLMNAAWM